MVQQPLHRLQKLPGGAGEPFLYDDRWGDPVGHVLPWSRIGIDGLANLVLSCGRCNGSKLHALPALDLVDRALSRERTVLEQIAQEITWPTKYDRVLAAARGLYRGQPAGTPTWAGPGRSSYLTLETAPGWLLDG